MRRLILWNLMTLDGFFEGPDPWSLDFHTRVWGDELEAFSITQLDEVGTLLFGRRTFTGMADYWANETGPIADRMNAIEKVVATRKGTDTSWPNSRALTGEINDHIDALKTTADPRPICVFGSADLSATLISHRAVDEIRLCLVPVVLGTGTPLFKGGNPRQDFTLLEARPLSTGGVILRYGKADE